MTVKLAVSTVTASLQGVLTRSETGTGTGTLVVYDGAEPETAATAISTQTALVTFVLPDPLWNAIESDATHVYADLEAVTPVNAAEDGTATFYRFLDGDGVVAFQGTVSTVGGGGDAELSAVDIIAGIEVTVVSFRLSQRYQPSSPG